MNYIYDIYLNFNDKLYDFFDWNKNDKLIHIKKIPIFKVNSDIFNKCVYNSIKIDETFLNSVHNKTELLNSKDKLNYCTLLTDSNNIIGISFNKNGNSIKKSFLCIDEELEILETINRFKETDINFKIIKKNPHSFKTRKQELEENFINNELKNIDKDKLNYIYFECFGKQEKNSKKIINTLKKLPKNSKIYQNLYNILKLTSTTKK